MADWFLDPEGSLRLLRSGWREARDRENNYAENQLAKAD
jgi:hypothetical protein